MDEEIISLHPTLIKTNRKKKKTRKKKEKKGKN